MKKEVIIFGNGGHFREIYSLVINDKKNKQAKNLKFIGIVDIKKKSGLDHYSNLSFKSESKIKYKKNLYLLIAIGNPKIRERIIKKYKKFNFMSFIHSSSIISNKIKLGKGVIIGPNCVFTSNAEIEDYNQFNSQCIISHDCKIGYNNQFSSGVKIMGKCNIGSKNFFGVDSKMIDGTQILNNNLVGANATITKNFASHNTIIGTPGKKK